VLLRRPSAAAAASGRGGGGERARQRLRLRTRGGGVDAAVGRPPCGLAASRRTRAWPARAHRWWAPALRPPLLVAESQGVPTAPRAAAAADPAASPPRLRPGRRRPPSAASGTRAPDRVVVDRVRQGRAPFRRRAPRLSAALAAAPARRRGRRRARRARAAAPVRARSRACFWGEGTAAGARGAGDGGGGGWPSGRSSVEVLRPKLEVTMVKAAPGVAWSFLDAARTEEGEEEERLLLCRARERREAALETPRRRRPTLAGGARLRVRMLLLLETRRAHARGRDEERERAIGWGGRAGEAGGGAALAPSRPDTGPERGPGSCRQNTARGLPVRPDLCGSGGETGLLAILNATLSPPRPQRPSARAFFRAGRTKAFGSKTGRARPGGEAVARPGRERRGGAGSLPKMYTDCRHACPSKKPHSRPAQLSLPHSQPTKPEARTKPFACARSQTTSFAKRKKTRHGKARALVVVLSSPRARSGQARSRKPPARARRDRRPRSERTVPTE